MKFKEIYNIYKKIKNKKYCVFIKDNNSDPELLELSISSLKPTNIDYVEFINIMRLKMINDIGEEQYYGDDLKIYDKDLYDSYLELEYLRARAEYYEKQYEYYKLMNDPNGGDANKAYSLYNHVLHLKAIYDEITQYYKTHK